MVFAVLTIIGLVLTTLASIAMRSLTEVAWHELELLCQQRQKPERFGRIFDVRERLEFGVSMFQAVAIAATSCMAFAWLIESSSPAAIDGLALANIIFLIAIIVVACAAWIPWAAAHIGAEHFLFYSWRWWWLASVLTWPLFICGQFVVKVFRRASGQEIDTEDEEDAFEEEILSIVSEAENDGVLEAHRAEMIEGVMDLDDNDVTKVMTPRSRIDSLDVATSWDDMVQFVVESGRTRIPVFEGTIDNIQGILYAKDLLRESLRSESKRRPLKKLLRIPIEAPSSTQLDQMLKLFLAGRMHMAVVIDEYGGLAGVVTIEDVLEEIVGEIEDELDVLQPQQIRFVNQLEADVNGDVLIEVLNERMGLTLPEEAEFGTLGGLIMNQLNEIPRPGHEISVDQVTFKIVEANRRSIRRVRVTITPNN